MLKEYSNLSAAIHALGESPPKLWLFTMALPHNLFIDNLSTRYKDASTKRQLKYITSVFKRWFSKYFRKAIIVPELTKNIPTCVHLHIITTSVFDSHTQWKDYYDDLYLSCVSLRKYDPYRIAFDLRPIYDIDGLEDDYLVKDDNFDFHVLYMEYTGKPTKIKFTKMIKKPLSSDEKSVIINNLNKGIQIDFNNGFD